MSTNRIAGIVLMTVGVLVCGTSGLCSLAFLAESGPNAANELLDGLGLLILLFGGIPFVIGALLIFGGWLALRNARRERERGGDPR